VRKRWSKKDLSTALLLGEQWLREAARPVENRRLRQILGVHCFAPIIAQLVEREPQLALEGARDSQRSRVLKNLADCSITPASADILPQRFAVAIREVFVRPLGHLLDRRQVAVHYGVANPLLGQDVM